MTCIKTGAVVHFECYGMSIRADVYRVGTSMVIRTGSGPITKESQFFDSCQRADPNRADYVIVNNPMNEFWRPDIGVFVVTADCLKNQTA